MSFTSILNIIGGLALFLFGMNTMSTNLQAAAGNEMKNILKKLTDTTLKGIFVGTAMTAIVQSSSATTVMLLGFVNAGIMTLSQSVGVIMGTNIGSTFTAQLIAFNIGHLAYIFIIAGVFLVFYRKNRMVEKWAYIVLGFGFLFIGLNVMSSAIEPLKESEAARQFLVNLTSSPLSAMLAGTVFTIIIQSSSAVIGIIIVLASTSLISYEGAIYLTLGSNIGTTVTAWLASFSVNKASKRVALIHSVFNIIGATVFCFLTYWKVFPLFVDLITPGDVYLGENAARHIANAHTLFNIFNSLMFFPFAKYLAVMAEKIIPGDASENVSMGEPKHLNFHLVSTPEIAIEQAILEMREMLKLVKLSINTAMQLYKEKNYRKIEKIDQIETAIDNLQKEITFYLVKINEKSNTDTVTKKIPSLLHTVNDIERLGDHAVQLSDILNHQILSQKVPFLADFEEEIAELHDKIIYMIDLSLEYMRNLDTKHSFMIIELEGRINQYHNDTRKRVLNMIQSTECDANSGLNMIDYIDTIETIADKLKNIVKAGSYRFIYQAARPFD
ncbi:MAG: Na/Pi cotransporter family protein [Candidatus Cloacimonadales bacterium]|jgi:phosphate:Na+ symporter|nr:Na/Pi cotransporter family protein [Candidatus Cloacimonadales bacterium]